MCSFNVLVEHRSRSLLLLRLWGKCRRDASSTWTYWKDGVSGNSVSPVRVLHALFLRIPTGRTHDQNSSVSAVSFAFGSSVCVLAASADGEHAIYLELRWTPPCICGCPAWLFVATVDRRLFTPISSKKGLALLEIRSRVYTQSLVNIRHRLYFMHERLSQDQHMVGSAHHEVVMFGGKSSNAHRCVFTNPKKVFGVLGMKISSNLDAIEVATEILLRSPSPLSSLWFQLCCFVKLYVYFASDFMRDLPCNHCSSIIPQRN